MQAAPGVETLARFLPNDALFPPNAAWAYHNAEIEKLWRYALPFLSVRAAHDIAIAEISLDEFVRASQEAQLRGLQIAIEHARRSKPRVSGCAFWQFNEPWPSICWSVVDFTRTPKRAYSKIKELYNPVLVSFAYSRRPRRSGESVSGQIWLINDTLNELRGRLSAWHNKERVLEQAVTLAANQARELARLELVLAAGANSLRFELRGENLLTTNEYDLNDWDMGKINLARALAANGAAWLRTRM